MNTMASEKRANLHSLESWKLIDFEETQKEFLLENGLKEIIYYRTFNSEDGKQRSMWTVSLLINSKDEAVARGVSVLSERDNLFKLEGRVRARGRAIRAVKTEKSSAYIVLREDNQTNKALVEAEIQFGLKSAYCPIITEEESTLIESAKKKLWKDI